MFRRSVLASLLGVCLGGWMFGQGISATPKPQNNWSEDELYGAFFSYVRFLDDMADTEQARGLDARWPRGKIKRDAGLTDQEESILKGINRHCNAAVKALDQKVGEIERQLRAKYTPNTLPKEVWQQYSDFSKQRRQIVLEHVQQLKSAFGAERFRILDSYARRATAARVKVFSVARPKQPPAK